MRFNLILILTLILAPKAYAFTDTLGHPYVTAIDWVQSQGIVQGYSDGTYRPNQTINRAEFTKIVVAAQFSPNEIDDLLARVDIVPFPDVPSDAWFTRYVYFALANGIIGGYPNGTFQPGNSVNFAEAAKIIVGAFNLAPNDNVIGDWWLPYVTALEDEDAVPQPVPKPDQLLTRGQMAEMIYLLSGVGAYADEDEDGAGHEEAECVTSGCSSQLCVEEGHEVMTTCEWREEYACYQDAECERQPDGTCGWTMTPGLLNCLSHPLDGEPAGAPGVYRDYYDGVVGNGERSVLFFHAAWCPFCRANDTRLQNWYATEELPVSVYKLDYDSATDLRAEFGVTTQDTFVLIDGNGETLRLESFPSEETLRDLLEG